MALMAADLSDNSDSLLQRTCEILNGTAKPQKVPNLKYSAPEILLNGKPFLIIRGWGSLKASGFSEADAAKIQDEFGAWVIDKLCGT